MSTGGGGDHPSVIIPPHTSLPQLFISAKLLRAETVEAVSPGAPPGQPHPLHGPAVAGLQSTGSAVARYSSHQQRLHAQSSQVQRSLKNSLRLHCFALRDPFRRVWLRLAAGGLLVDVLF